MPECDTTHGQALGGAQSSSLRHTQPLPADLGGLMREDVGRTKGGRGLTNAQTAHELLWREANPVCLVHGAHLLEGVQHQGDGPCLGSLLLQAGVQRNQIPVLQPPPPALLLILAKFAGMPTRMFDH